MHLGRVGILVLPWIFMGCNEPRLPSSVAPARQDVATTVKVVLFVIDGARLSETFDDPTHTHIPSIWNELRPQGAIVSEFWNGGDTRTVPGHASMITGTWQALANDGSQRPDMPTLFEYLRATHAVPQSETYVISGKGKLDVCSYSTHADYGPTYGATEDVGLSTDGAVYGELISVLQTERPRLVLACFPSVDTSGHSGVWTDYLAAIDTADSLAAACWAYLEADPYYAGQTYLIITNDHGRHDDQNGGFQSHGDGCPGCRRIMFLALGPDVRAGYVATGVYDLRDICQTVASILDVDPTEADGHVIQEIFEPVSSGIPISGGPTR